MVFAKKNDRFPGHFLNSMGWGCLFMYKVRPFPRILIHEIIIDNNVKLIESVFVSGLIITCQFYK